MPNVDGDDVTEPVKLSRERWDSLTRGGHPDYERVTILRSVIGIIPRATITEPLTFDGITFLPATYVPDSAPSSAPYSMRTFASELDWRA